ncbi:hypothetical protein BD311DRAFT_170545 [Dichomitus squalens]|uniref:Uncharacterized protein n=1 Tax=Dichomitus squalens TaxID=114155 RepID=A0A4Q9M814_9APHY|nr:hypothetical protein BD311DRAFT_170545 [Dichomitus squalens]
MEQWNSGSEWHPITASWRPQASRRPAILVSAEEQCRISQAGHMVALLCSPLALIWADNSTGSPAERYTPIL